MTGAFPFSSSVLFRRILLAGAVICAVLLMTAPAPAPAQTNPPDYDSPQLCATLGGTLLPVAGENVCRGLDATGTFCIVGSKDAFPCRGLYKRVDYCNKLNRPTLNPFICGPVCANGTALGGTCQLLFAETTLQTGQPFTFTHESVQRTGAYHGQRRSLHLVHFTEPNIIRENQNRLPTYADHAAQCALGNPEGQTSPWRPPTLAEAAILLADPETPTVPVSDADPDGRPDPATTFHLPLPPNTCAGQCAEPLNRPVAYANAILAGNIIRPEILTPAPQTEANPALSLVRSPYQTRDPAVVFPCVAAASEGYNPPPLDVRIQITPDPAQATLRAYAAPNAPPISANTPLFTVSAVAQRYAATAPGASPLLTPHPASITLFARVAENLQTLPGLSRVVFPVRAPAPLAADQTLRLSVSLRAVPQVGPVAEQAYQYARIPVQNPPPVTVVALSSIIHRPVSISAEGQTTTLDAVVVASVAYAEITLPPEMSDETQIGILTVTTRRPFGVFYHPDLPNNRIIRRGPAPTRDENIVARYTHPKLSGNLSLLFTFRPALRQADDQTEFIPAADLKRGGFSVFQTESIPLFTLTSSVPATRFEFIQPLNADPLNYQGFAHRVVDNYGGQLEFSAVPLSVATQITVAPASVFYVARSPTGSNTGWYPAFPAEGEFGAARVFTYLRDSFAVVGVDTNSQCSQVPGATRLLPDPSDPTNLDAKNVYICDISLCRGWGGSRETCRTEARPTRVVFGDFFPKKIRESDSTIVSDASNLAGQPANNLGLQPDPPDFAPTPSEIVLIDLHPLHRARCLPVAEAKSQNLIPASHPAADSVLFCPPPVRTATIILAAQNPEYQPRALALPAPPNLPPQTIRAAAILTLEITVSVRTDGINFNPDQWFPPDNTANFLRPPDDGGERYHPARVAPDFASQISTETSGEKTETVIRHPVMIARIPPNIRHNIAIPPNSGFALTIVPRDRTPVPKTAQTGDPFEGEGRGHPHYPAQIRYAQPQNQPGIAEERLAVFYVPPNQPIPEQTSRQAVIRFTVTRAAENSQTEITLGAAQLTLSLTAVAQMPIHDAASAELNERYNYWHSVPVQDVVPPEVLGMQNVFPELISENLLKDGTMTYLGAYRPKLRPGHVHNPHAFTIIARDEPAAFAMRLNSTLTSNLGLVPRSQIENHTPLFAGDHIISVKYSNPNVFLGEYHMTFRAHIPPASESSTAHWDAGWSIEEGVRRMLSFTPEQIGEVVIDQSGTMLKNYPWTKSMLLDNDNPPLNGLEEALLYQKWTAEWLTRVQTELNAYVANPEITVFLDGEVPPNNYHAAIERAVEWMYERIAYDDGGSFISPPYVGFSLAHLGYYSAPVADTDARRRSIATFLYRHQPSNRIMQAPHRIGEGFTGTLFTYDPQLSYQRQSADVRARIPPDAPNRFELPNGLAGMFVPIPSGVVITVQTRDGQSTRVTAQTGGGYLEVVETGDGRLQISVPLPLGRFPGGTPPPVVILTGDSDDEPPAPPPTTQPTGTEEVGNVFLPHPPPQGSGDGEFVVHRGADILKRKPPPNYARSSAGTRILLTTEVTIQEVRSYVTVDAVLYVDLTIENGADLPAIEMPLSEARAGESFPVVLPESERRRFPGGGEWRSNFESSPYALSLRTDNRVALTHDLTLAGLYLLPLDYHPAGENDLMGGVRYRFALRALKTEGDAATELAQAAANGNRDEVARLLRESPVPGTAKAASGPYAGKTPLHAALMGFSAADLPPTTEARINIVWKLVENGANHWTTDNEGLAPMHRAMHSAAHNNTTLPIRALATAPFPSGDWYEARTVTAALGSRSRQTEIDDKVTITARYALGPESAVMANGLTTALQYGAEQAKVALDNSNVALVRGWGAAVVEFVRFYGVGGTGCNPNSGPTSLPGCLRQEFNARRDASTGETQLHVAVRMQQTMTVEALLAGGADVNAGLVSPVDIGNSPSPMHYAVSLADYGVVDLLARGFKKDKTGGECPLGVIPTVVEKGSSECLVRTNYKPGGSWIHDPINYPSVAITPPIYATILLAEELSSSSPDATRVTMLQRISMLLAPQITLPPVITATITPAQLTGVAKEVYDWLIVAVNTRGEPTKSGVKIVRDAFLNYLNGDDYFAPIGAFLGKVTNDENTSLINAVAGAFVNGGADPDNKCALESDLSGSEFYDCGFSAVPRLEGVVVEISVVVPDTPIINRVVAADFVSENFILYWRPPLYDGGSPITGYRIFREQNAGNDQIPNAHPTECDSASYPVSLEAAHSFIVGVDHPQVFAYMVNPGSNGVTYGNCYRWKISAVNAAGHGSAATTHPILSRGFKVGNVLHSYDDTKNNTGESCPAGESRPYAYNANNWGTTCYPDDRLDRADKCNSLRAVDNVGGATRFEPSTNECYVDYTASDVEHQPVCVDNGLDFVRYAASREHCLVPPQCGTLSEYNRAHRECHCQGWAQPTPTADSTAPAECECKVSGADANCACPSPKKYDPATHSCI